MPNVNIRFKNNYTDSDGIIQSNPVNSNLSLNAQFSMLNPNTGEQGVMYTVDSNAQYNGTASFSQDYHFFTDDNSETWDEYNRQRLETTFTDDYNLGTGPFHISFWLKPDPDTIPLDEDNNPVSDGIILVVGFDNMKTVKTYINFIDPTQWTWFCFMRDSSGTFKVFQDNQVVASDVVTSNFNLTGNSYIYIGEVITPNTNEDDNTVDFEVDDIYILKGNVFSSFDKVVRPTLADGYQAFNLERQVAFRKREDDKLYGYTDIATNDD